MNSAVSYVHATISEILKESLLRDAQMRELHVTMTTHQ